MNVKNDIAYIVLKKSLIIMNLGEHFKVGYDPFSAAVN